MPSKPPERSDPTLAAFVPVAEAGTAAEIPIHSPNARIGQGARNEIVFDDDTVSTHHAQLEYASGTWHLTDLNSKNGTFLNGTRIAPGVPTPLPTDAEIAFGALKLKFAARADLDPTQAFAAYTPAPEPPNLAARAGFRVPVWLAVLILLVVAALVILLLSLGDSPQIGEPILASAGHLLCGRGPNQRAA